MPSPIQSKQFIPSELAVSCEHIYTVGNKILARGTGRQLGDHGIALVCPTCGDLWARVFPAHGNFDWRAPLASCPACPHGHSAWFPSGSFIPGLRIYSAGFGTDYDWTHNLPPEVLKWEAARYLNYYEYVLRPRLVAHNMPQ